MFSAFGKARSGNLLSLASFFPVRRWNRSFSCSTRSYYNPYRQKTQLIDQLSSQFQVFLGQHSQDTMELSPLFASNRLDIRLPKENTIYKDYFSL
jgi:hypothetical protein